MHRNAMQISREDEKRQRGHIIVASLRRPHVKMRRLYRKLSQLEQQATSAEGQKSSQDERRIPRFHNVNSIILTVLRFRCNGEC
jgi:hypothetical protein